MLPRVCDFARTQQAMSAVGYPFSFSSPNPYCPLVASFVAHFLRRDLRNTAQLFSLFRARQVLAMSEAIDKEMLAEEVDGSIFVLSCATGCLMGVSQFEASPVLFSCRSLRWL